MRFSAWRSAEVLRVDVASCIDDNVQLSSSGVSAASDRDFAAQVEGEGEDCSASGDDADEHRWLQTIDVMDPHDLTVTGLDAAKE